METENIERVVSLYAPATKVGAVVGGQTSVKYPEIQAFTKHLPADTHIVTCHSLHGPSVDPHGQPLVVMRHRCPSDQVFEACVDTLKSLGSEIVNLSTQEHDKITADTQAVTHLAFLSMGSAWRQQGVFPWLNTQYTGGIENVKVMTTLRIYGSKWHVYAGLAILNPSARVQIRQYAASVSALYKLMVQEREQEFRERVYAARTAIFGDPSANGSNQSVLLSDEWLDEFSMGSVPSTARKPNSHLSLLAMADCWLQLKMSPYDNLICQTPPFRLWLGITEYLFKSPEMLESAITASLTDRTIRADDLEFLLSSQAWSQTILLGSMDGYKQRFQETSAYFENKLDEAKRRSGKMMQIVAEKWQQRKK